jgi:hypothetical protein
MEEPYFLYFMLTYWININYHYLPAARQLLVDFGLFNN